MERYNNRLDELFNQAKKEQPKVSFEQTKQRFLTAAKHLKSQRNNFFNLKNSLIMTLSAAIIIIATSLISTQNKPMNNKSMIAQQQKKVVAKKIKQVPIDRNKNKNMTATHSTKAPVKHRIAVAKSVNTKKPKKIKNTGAIVRWRPEQKNDTAYQFPILTEKEIKDNNKRKKRFLKLNSKLELYGFLKIPKGKMQLKNKTIQVKGFEIKQEEMSNLQYRTFLYDLLIQGRKADYLKALPKQKNWEKAGLKNGKYMEENYFFNEKYDHYPVVNISRKATIMYCKWLSNGINKENAKKLNGKKVIVRLPTINEWIYAARGGKDNMYGWPNVQGRQNKLGYFLGNFRYNPKVDTIPICSKCKAKIKYPQALTTAGALIGKDVYTVQTYSYNPNAFGLYCMSGNVAEMVTYSDGSVGSKGGSWNSPGKDIKILAPDEYKGIISPNIEIGFRPVIIIK